MPERFEPRGIDIQQNEQPQNPSRRRILQGGLTTAGIAIFSPGELISQPQERKANRLVIPYGAEKKILTYEQLRGREGKEVQEQTPAIVDMVDAAKKVGVPLKSVWDKIDMVGYIGEYFLYPSDKEGYIVVKKTSPRDSQPGDQTNVQYDSEGSAAANKRERVAEYMGGKPESWQYKNNLQFGEGWQFNNNSEQDDWLFLQYGASIIVFPKRKNAVS